MVVVANGEKFSDVRHWVWKFIRFFHMYQAHWNQTIALGMEEHWNRHNNGASEAAHLCN